MASAVETRAVIVENEENKTMKGQEKSDRRIVPRNGGNAPGGRSATASKMMGQLELFSETADNPKGNVAGMDPGKPGPAPSAVPKSETTTGSVPSATMTMEEVTSHENLMRAFQHVASRQGAPGPDRQSIDEARDRLDETLRRLQRELLAGAYRPGMIRRVWIPKPGGGQRGLGIPNVVDRWVQQAVLQVMNPQYDPTFHDSSHGFRPGRSCHTAIMEAKGYVEEGHEWVVDIDLEKFFDRVHHDRLLARLEKDIEDRRLLQLIRRMLKAKVVMPDGVVVTTEEGTPQGGPLSPLLSNIVLDELDREFARRGHCFVRYADDAKIYVRSERAGNRVMASVTWFIESRLRLTVNQAKSAVARTGERHFVGFCLRREPEDGTVEIDLSERTKKRIDRRIRELTPRTWGRSLADCIRRINSYLDGWMNFFGICTAAAVRKLQCVDAHIRRRLRAILLRHWKRRPTMARRLVKLGVKPSTAWRAMYKGSRSWWALSRCAAVHQGLSNAYFVRRGLVSLDMRWQERKLRGVTVAPSQLELTLG